MRKAEHKGAGTRRRSEDIDGRIRIYWLGLTANESDPPLIVFARTRQPVGHNASKAPPASIEEIGVRCGHSLKASINPSWLTVVNDPGGNHGCCYPMRYPNEAF